MTTAHLEIKGKVQGVFYRATASRIAEKNNLKGWIKNKNSGEVEIVVTGKKEDVETFIDWCRHGPEKAVVDEVNITFLKETLFKEFSVKR
ncbi:MAG: acylphosphatase [Ginsengibacter sp.]